MEAPRGICEISSENVNTDVYYAFAPIITIEPADASIQTLEWSSSNTSVATVNENGTVLGQGYGKATITGKSMDGSNKTVNIKVNVPLIWVSDDDITITDANGATILYARSSANGINSFGVRITDEVLSASFSSGERNKPDIINIYPIRAGKGTIKLTRNGKVVRIIKVNVAHSAVYDNVSYPPVSISHLLDNKSSSIGIKTQFNCDEIIAYGEKFIGLNKDKTGTSYIIFSLKHNNPISEPSKYTFYGIVSSFENYTTPTGLSYECPCFTDVVKYEK